MSTTAHTLWHLGSMNDGLFIINTPPSPAGTDAPPWENPNGPTMVLNIVELPVGKAQKIVDAHNAAVNSHDALTARIAELEELDRQSQSFLEAERALVSKQDARIAEQEKRIDALKAALKPFAQVADMEHRAGPAESVMVNVARCRDARAALTEGEGA